MMTLKALQGGLRSVARRDAVERELDEELRFHLEMEAAKNERAGMSPEEARRAALVAFGGIERHKEAVRDGRGVRWLEDGAADVRYALRGLRLRPGLAAAVVLLLALGIGANGAMFGVVDRLLLRPPAGVRAPGGVVRLYWRQTFSWAGTWTGPSASYPMYALLRDQARELEGIAAYNVSEVSFGRGQAARAVQRAAASASLFTVLGVRPRLGRVFTAEEDRAGAGATVAVLSAAFWRRSFGGDPGVLGRVVRLGARPYTIVGVLEPGFGGLDLEPVDVWVPLGAATGEAPFDTWYGQWGSTWLNVVARLRPGVPPAQAEAEATGLFRRGLAEEQAGEARSGGVASASAGPAPVDPTARVLFGSIIAARAGAGEGAAVARESLWLQGVALVVLLIACANVASLLLARALARRKETAVRLALGVSRGRLTRQLVVETLVLAALGGLAALVVAAWCGGGLRRLLLPDVGWEGAPVSGSVLALTAVLVLAAALLAGLAPAVQSWRVAVADTLKAGSRDGTQRRSRLRAGLVVAQAALTVLLLVGAGLFVRSLRNVQAVPRGFDPEHVVVVDLGLDRVGYPAVEAERLTERARERLRHLPGIREAALGTGVPFRQSYGISLRVPGVDSLPIGKDGGPYVSDVTPDYFRALGTRITAGRGFTESDREGARRVAVVSATMARLLWPGRNPLGRCIQVGGVGKPCTEVVGVAENALRQDVADTPVLQFYLPLAQREKRITPAVVFLHTAGLGKTAEAAVRREVQALSADLPYADVLPMAALVDPNIQPWRLGATVFSLLGLLALVVAVLGLYGIVAYDVARRAPEMAIRAAMGAPGRRVVGLVVGDALRLALTGVALGGVGALLAGRAVAPLLYKVSPHDPTVLLGVAGVLLAAAAAAAVVPARRASRVDPATALRAE